jgi:hypothetical protein
MERKSSFFDVVAVKKTSKIEKPLVFMSVYSQGKIEK